MQPKEVAKGWIVLRSYSDFTDLDTKVKASDDSSHSDLNLSAFYRLLQTQFSMQRLALPPDFVELPR